MMIDFSEADILEGQMAKAIDGLVGREFARAYLLEKFANGFGVHATVAVGIQPTRTLA